MYPVPPPFNVPILVANLVYDGAKYVLRQSMRIAAAAASSARRTLQACRRSEDAPQTASTLMRLKTMAKRLPPPVKSPTSTEGNRLRDGLWGMLSRMVSSNTLPTTLPPALRHYPEHKQMSGERVRLHQSQAGATMCQIDSGRVRRARPSALEVLFESSGRHPQCAFRTYILDSSFLLLQAKR